jgi:anti-anti-sigma factor
MNDRRWPGRGAAPAAAAPPARLPRAAGPNTRGRHVGEPMTMVHDGFAISSQCTGTTVRITVAGELDIATATHLREHTSRPLAEPTELVVLDLTDVSFIDSSGLHALLDAAAQGDSRLRIVPSPVCLRLFDIAGVRDRLPLI